MNQTRRNLLKFGAVAGAATIATPRLVDAAENTQTKGRVMDPTQEDALIDRIAKGVSYSFRTPILRRPSDFELDYEDVFFPAVDGVMLDGWFVPAQGSDKLIICNHFIGANRYGYPGHLPPWDQQGGFEVNLVQAYKALHEAGYNVLAYEFAGSWPFGRRRRQHHRRRRHRMARRDRLNALRQVTPRHGAHESRTAQSVHGLQCDLHRHGTTS